MPPKPQSKAGPGQTRGGAGSRSTAAGTNATGKQRAAVVSSSSSQPRRTTPAVPAGSVGRKAPTTAAKKPGAGPGRGRVVATSKGGKAPALPKPEGSKTAPKKSTWTKEDEMARKIQTHFRGYRCRKLLLQLKSKQDEYDKLMDKLQKDAYVQLAKLERERAEREREKEEAERKKKREQMRRVKRMLEAAFDGDTQEINTILKEVATLYAEESDLVVQRHQYKLVECTDPNNNTPLSEAGAGGDPDTLRLLLSLGADPNSKGQFGRTPLYRAAFAGHLDAVQVLLESGSDPRIHDNDGALPVHVAGKPEVEEFLKSWEVSETEQLLVRLEEVRERRQAEQNQLRQTEEERIHAEIREAEKENSARQNQLSKAYEELNKRIFEHDKCVSLKPDITLQAIHDAEDDLERTKLLAEEAREKLQQAKLNLRMKRKEFLDVSRKSTMGGATYMFTKQMVDDEEPESADVVITIRELDDVLMKDVGDKIAASGKWPLIIDTSKQSAVFLRYRDTNYLDVCNPKHMDPETIRISLLGAIRYGKFVVVDLLNIEDMWPAVVQRFDLVQKNLLQNLMSKELLQKEKYLSLIKPTDGEEYSPKMFLGARIHNFKLVILTQLFNPPEELMDQCYVIRIHIPEQSF